MSGSPSSGRGTSGSAAGYIVMGIVILGYGLLIRGCAMGRNWQIVVGGAIVVIDRLLS